MTAMREPDFNDADWSVALDAQLDLHRFWGTTNGARVAQGFGRSYADAYAYQAMADTEHEEHPAIAFAHTMLRDNMMAPLDIDKHELQVLGRAATYFASDEMVEFASWISRTMGDTTNLTVDMLPHPAGFIWLDGGVTITDAHGDTFVVSAMSWGTDAFDDPTVPGVDYAVYTDLTDPRDSTDVIGPIRDRPELRTIARTTITHVGAVLYGERTWPTAEALATDGAELILSHGERVKADAGYAEAIDSTLGIERWLIAFWLMIGEKITVVSKRRPDRASRRRFEREVRVNLNSPDETSVRTVMLRKSAAAASYETAEDDGESWTRWSHRWYVSPHWRRIHQGTEKERVVRVQGYIKGPEHAPLILRDDVYRVVR